MQYRFKSLSIRQVLMCSSAALLLSTFSVLSQPTSIFSPHKLSLTSGNHQDMFGFSVDVDGDHALIGAIKYDSPSNGQNTGGAFLYQLHQGKWQFTAALSPSTSKPDDGFGGKLAIDKSTLAVGAIGYDGSLKAIPLKDSGAVFVFNSNALNPNNQNGWHQTSMITAPDAQNGDAFGQSIALAGERLIIGAPKDDDKGEDSGSVYIFEQQEGAWRFTQKLTAPDGAAGDVFGISLSMSGDTLLIGADLHDETANNAGAAYVYTKVKGIWQFEAKLMADDAGDTDIFGVRVALDNNTAVISARRDDHQHIGKDAGSVYVFQRTGNKWVQQAKLIGPDSQADDRFGRDVAIRGDTLLISAMNKDDQGENAGVAYLYKRQQQQWTLVKTLYASDAAAGDRFGWSVALSKQQAVIGAVFNAKPRRQNGVNSSINDKQHVGAAYVFPLNNTQ